MWLLSYKRRRGHSKSNGDTKAVFTLPFDVAQTFAKDLLQWRGDLSSNQYPMYSQDATDHVHTANANMHANLKLCDSLFHKEMETPDTVRPPPEQIPLDLKP